MRTNRTHWAQHPGSGAWRRQTGRRQTADAVVGKGGCGEGHRIREGFLEEVVPALISEGGEAGSGPLAQPTWKTLMRACGKLSKLLRRTSVSSKSYLPPKSCMPSRAQMMMKRKSSSSREAMERMELSRDATRLLRDVQYLQEGGGPHRGS